MISFRKSGLFVNRLDIATKYNMRKEIFCQIKKKKENDLQKKLRTIKKLKKYDKHLRQFIDNFYIKYKHNYNIKERLVLQNYIFYRNFFIA